MGKKERRIRISNGAHAILEATQHQPLRCIFVGDTSTYLNGGTVPIDLDLIVIPQPGIANLPDIAHILCGHRSTRFKFSLEGDRKLKYIDLTGEIPSGKQNWSYVKTTICRSPLPFKFELENVVTIRGIPTLDPFGCFTDLLQDLLGRYDSQVRFNSQQGESWLGKNQIKKGMKTIDPIKNKVVPPNLDRAREALSLSQRFFTILSMPRSIGGPASSQSQQLKATLQNIVKKIEHWVNTRPCHSVSAVAQEDKKSASSSPVTETVPVNEKGPEPSTASAVGGDEDCGEPDDQWVEVTLLTGMIKTHESDLYPCGEVDGALDFELVAID